MRKEILKIKLKSVTCLPSAVSDQSYQLSSVRYSFQWTTEHCTLLQADLCAATDIMKACLYNFDPLKPHFYIVKLGFTGVYIIFLFLLKNIDCGYSLELPRRGGSNGYPQSMFWAEIWKISEFFIWKFSFFGGKISVYLNRRVFIMYILKTIFINPFIPEFLEWTLPFLNLDMSTVVNRGF